MVHRDELIRQLDDLLEIEGVEDYGPNGLQVEGAPEVHKVITGVTASLAFIETAVEMQAQMVVVHHGIYWNGQPVVLRGHLKKRVQALLESGITLLGYHLPLDRHAEVGNNAPALRDMGLDDLEPFARHRGTFVGWKGRFTEPVSAGDLLERVQRYYGSEPVAFMEGPDQVSTVGLVSGAAQSDLASAVRAGLDAFITGEVSEYNPHIAREEGIHHISVGHHASERIGPRKLAAWLSGRFDTEVEFVDLHNPV